MDYTITVTGWDELIKKCNDPAVLGEPMRDFFTKSTLEIQRDTQELTPVDTGRLRASFTSMVDPSPMPLFGQMGTVVEYAPYVEFGTRPHFPPISALRAWGASHGINPYLVARAIARRGTRARLMLQTAINNNMSNLNTWLGEAARSIEDRWSAK